MRWPSSIRLSFWTIQDLSAAFKAVLDCLSQHAAPPYMPNPDGKRHDGERRIAGRAAGELAAIRDEQILDVVGLAEFVHDTILRFGPHPVGAHVMGTWIGRGRIRHCRANRLVNRGPPFAG